MIKKSVLIVAAALTFFIGCKKDGAGVAPQQKDSTAFGAYEERFLDGLWKINPDLATQVGYHKYDSILIIPNADSRQKQLTFTRKTLDSLGNFDLNSLTDNGKIDYHLMENQMQYTQWGLQQEKAYEWDPSAYNVIGTFAFILNEKYEPLDKRLRNFYMKMLNIPVYYKEAEKQLKNPVAELTALAIDQHTGGVSVFESDFADSLKKTTIPQPEKQKMLDRAKLSADAIKGYAAWLKGMKNDHPRSFRLGKELYQDKFKYEVQSASTPQQIYNAAIERKKYLHKEMAKYSKQLWPKYFGKAAMPTDTLELIGKMIDTLSAKHVQPDEFQSAISAQIPKLTAFVKSKDLLYIDPSKPLVVRKEPAYMAGVAGASVTSPGPYDKTGNTYFNVGSLSGWPAAKAESYLREYNQYILQILCIHEAIPGHYTQLVYANKSPSLIKSILGNGAMIEGWAVYTEQMMLENGYGNNEPEMWLMWYKWNLRSVCNTIVDYSVHTGTMTKEQVVKMLTHEAFQQQAEADNKWKRVSVTSVQLTSYYSGYKEIIDLREAYKKKVGDKLFKLKDFNEKFLGYGSAPVKYISELMLKKK
ncbi:DUF885 domain-containing protein [Mucilaginibacter polytrichastri]|uniref:DUF885 domain-containing protein n=1 Tax=Mucilaginibacter polytrichastri TaxID=1302689 RepID=A0A1Q6A164_9SPHI|nr:DUF885 domain-containing protein [Mucilaginibacter polytrichastri]OKS87738.1 hypothetical protein RG47T_3200 [Mucilaginibacter polytrichastri]SFT19883.1 Uncharacterized conserved protein, DUF885 familyt [Mucilaginibacter polytrichastri]